MVPRILGVLLLCLVCAVQAGVYTYIDAEGNRVYTDQSPNRRKTQHIELAPGDSVTSSGIRYRPPVAPLEVKPPIYQLLRILLPEPDATPRANSGNVIVTITSEPALLPGHRYRLLLDGESVGVSGRGPMPPLKNLDRGTHQVTVEIIDSDGMIIESTPNQPFHLHQVSIARQSLPEVDTSLVSAVQPNERQPNFLYPFRRGRGFPAFFPTPLAKTPPATLTYRIGAITRTTFYTVPTLGHRSSPKIFPAHLWPAPRQKKRVFSVLGLFLTFSYPTLEQLPAMSTDTLHRLSLDNLTTAVILPNGELRLEYMNPTAETLLIVSDQYSHGQFISELFIELPETLSPLHQAVEQAHPFTKREATLTSIIGASIMADYAVMPILNRNETLLLLEVHPCDRLMRITREKAQLSKQETTKLLVHRLAHEIKNPFGGVRGAAQLSSHELPEKSLKDCTNIIIEGTGRLRSLVDCMLGSNRLPNLVPINICEVLGRVSSLVEAESQGDITLVRDYDPSISDLLLDRERMIQAVLNMVRNAMQATAGQNDLRLGRITLRSRALHQFTVGHMRHRLVCKVEIIDNGSGIPTELQETIFYPVISGRPNGTGLGLAITQDIISQYQGLIECKNHLGRTVSGLFLSLE